MNGLNGLNILNGSFLGDRDLGCHSYVVETRHERGTGGFEGGNAAPRPRQDRLHGYRSIATNFYTVPRMTRDIDIIVELFEKDLSRFIPLFEADYYLEPETVGDAVKTKGMFNLIQMNTSSRSTSSCEKIHSTAAGNSPGEGKLRSIIRISSSYHRKI